MASSPAPLSFIVGTLLVGGIPLEMQTLESGHIGKEEAVAESELRIDMVSQHNMAEFMSQNHCQRCFIRQYIEQTATDDDRVAYRERLQRQGQQYATAYIRLNLQFVGDDEIVDHGLQDLVHITRRREQSNLLQMVYRVVFCHPFPHTLSFDRAIVFGNWAIIHRVVNFNLRKFFVVIQLFWIVAPETCLSF